jgi:hypothetical protein
MEKMSPSPWFDRWGKNISEKRIKGLSDEKISVIMNQMNISALTVLHQYNHYANSLLFESADLLSEEDLTRSSSPSHGSVLGLLQHMLGTEVYFLLECQGLPPAPDTDEITSLKQLKELFFRFLSSVKIIWKP